ncbi:hypothetical protein SFUMM280S_06054 [Streptomyces fumanus]
MAGEAFGRRLDEAGAEKAVCVVHEQGNVGLTQRCDGVKRTFDGTIENLYVNGTDMPSVQSTITAKLKQDTGIDHVVTLGAPFAMTAVQSVDETGGKAKVATFDLNKDLAAAVRAGDRVRRRPAALPPGLPGRRRPVAVREQRQLQRRRRATGAHLTGVRRPDQRRAGRRLRREGHPVMSAAGPAVTVPPAPGRDPPADGPGNAPWRSGCWPGPRSGCSSARSPCSSSS